MTPTSELIEIARENRKLGQIWYLQAKRESMQVAERMNTEFHRFASLLALFSPRVSVVRSVRLTITYVGTGGIPVSTLGNTRSAIEHYEQTGEIRGPKVKSFREAICGCWDAIVLDVHMANVLDIPQSDFSRASARQLAQTRVQEVAREIGLSPRDTQAALWCGQLRRIGREPKPMPIYSEYLNWLAHNMDFPDQVQKRGYADGTYQLPMFD